MKLIVGLGNPGDKYAGTRHNAGFWFVERLAAQSGTILRKDGKFQALVGRHEASGAWLVLPQSYMNSSGRPVQMMASFFKIQPAEVLVVHDELDLPPGTARLKQSGGVAGHNGLKDISARLASHDYWRLRLGIGRPAERSAMIDYVLHKPAQEERVAIDEAIARSLEVLPLVLSGDTQGAMLKLHTRDAELNEKAAAAPGRQPVPARGERQGTQEHPPGRPEEVRPAETAERPAVVERPAAVTAAPAAGEPVAPAHKEKVGEGGEEAARARKKSALNSLLDKFAPRGSSGRKK
jgi:PTH1 family peptidyl-tRNA hydrolase